MNDQEMSQSEGGKNAPNTSGEGEGGATPRPDELTMLKQRAKLLGITFSNNIGLDALREKVNAKIGQNQEDGEADESEDVEEQEEAQDEDPAPASLSDEERAELEALRAAVSKQAAQGEAKTITSALNPLVGDKAGEIPAKQKTKRQRVIDDAMRLIRVRITNLDPKKKELHGEILCVGNRYIGTVKKFIPYGELTDNGYHIPKVLFDELDSRKFLHIRTTRNKQNGQIEVKTSYAKEFALEVLPPLTQEELARLAAAQSAASNADSGN